MGAENQGSEEQSPNPINISEIASLEASFGFEGQEVITRTATNIPASARETAIVTMADKTIITTDVLQGEHREQLNGGDNLVVVTELISAKTGKPIAMLIMSQSPARDNKGKGHMPEDSVLASINKTDGQLRIGVGVTDGTTNLEVPKSQDTGGYLKEREGGQGNFKYLSGGSVFFARHAAIRALQIAQESTTMSGALNAIKEVAGNVLSSLDQRAVQIRQGEPNPNGIPHNPNLLPIGSAVAQFASILINEDGRGAKLVYTHVGANSDHGVLQILEPEATMNPANKVLKMIGLSRLMWPTPIERKNSPVAHFSHEGSMMGRSIRELMAKGQDAIDKVRKSLTVGNPTITKDIQPGQTLVMSTDGITKEDVGYNLQAILENARTPEDVVKALANLPRAADEKDDRTFFAIRVL